MIVDLGDRDPLAEGLADELGISVRRRTPASDLGPDSILVAPPSKDLATDRAELLKAGIASGATVVLRDARPRDMADLGLFGVHADTAVVRCADGGRRQQIVVDGRLASAADLTSSLTSATPRGLRRLVPRRWSEPVPPTESGDVGTAPSPPRAARMVEDVAALADIDAGADWTRSNPALATLRLQIGERKTVAHDGSESRIFGSFVVELAAIDRPIRAKRVRITSEGTAVWARPSSDVAVKRGYFTTRAGVKYYPIALADDAEWPAGYDLSLPPGWTRIAIAPKTPNETSTYTRTTGWSVGAKVSGEAGKESKVSVGLEASYSESESLTTTIKDFRVRNHSTAAVSDWVYEYSALADNPWALLIAKAFRWPKCGPAAGLATSMLELGNETVYEAPADCTSVQPFHFELGHHLVRFWQSGSSYFNSRLNQVTWSPIGVQTSLHLPMGIVRHSPA